MFESFTYINPFKTGDLPQELVNFATGAVATPDIQKNLIEALDRDETMARAFVRERLVCSDSQEQSAKSFYDSMARGNIRTMADNFFIELHIARKQKRMWSAVITDTHCL